MPIVTHRVGSWREGTALYRLAVSIQLKWKDIPDEIPPSKILIASFIHHTLRNSRPLYWGPGAGPIDLINAFTVGWNRDRANRLAALAERWDLAELPDDVVAELVNDFGAVLP